ncbi:hypothetical protein ABUH87_11385 [Novosphingobium sp. M1R2S20]|uniref:Alpha/beta hydrolase n=1 Tax=Novosphingobium rhizovicinum TaxID=3228928 RepID=A0ABV3RCC2_9SPHN
MANPDVDRPQNREQFGRRNVGDRTIADEGVGEVQKPTLLLHGFGRSTFRLYLLQPLLGGGL